MDIKVTRSIDVGIRIVKPFHITHSEPNIAFADVAKKHTLLTGKDNLINPVESLGHWNDITSDISQVLAQQNLAVWNPHEVQVPLELAT